MKTIVCEKPGVFKEMEAGSPIPKNGEAIITIKRVGICGTDLHAFQGNQPFFAYPRVFGHELAGVIDWIGENEYGLKQGDQVAIIPYLHCGECIACRNGKTNCCTNMKVLGVHVDGGMAEQISVPEAHLIKTGGLTLDQTAVIEPLSIGAHAIRRAQIQAGEFVLVVGAGPIGLGVMVLAKSQGAKVIAMDINNERLEYCRKWAQADYLVNALETPLDALKEITGGDLPTVVFDATGSPKSMESSFTYAAHGGRIVFVGLAQAEITFFDPNFHSRELTIMSSRNATREDFKRVMEVVKSGEVDVNRYITHRCKFHELIQRFEDYLKPESNVIKAIVEL